MKYQTVKILTLVALFSGCTGIPINQGPYNTQDPTPTPSPSATPKAVATPAPVKGKGYLTFSPVEYYTTPDERVIIKKAEKKINEVYQTECFANWLMKRKLIQTGKRTNAQVIEHLRTVKFNVPMVMYYRRITSAVAYREPPDPTINLNRRNFWPDQGVCHWSKTMAHEASHSLDYDHDYEWSPSRSYSVPYSLGGGDEAQGGDVMDACCND